MNERTKNTDENDEELTPPEKEVLSTYGYNLVRSRLAGTSLALVTSEEGAIHPSARIGKGPVGRGVRVGEGSVIDGSVFGLTEIGRNTQIARNAKVGSPLKLSKKTTKTKEEETPEATPSMIRSPEIIIGNNVIIGSGTRIHRISNYTVTIGHDTEIESGVIIGKRLNDKHTGSIFLGDNCHIGRKVMIYYGVSIGSNTEIDSGYIIKTDIPPNVCIQNRSVAKRPVAITEAWLKNNRHLIIER